MQIKKILAVVAKKAGTALLLVLAAVMIAAIALMIRIATAGKYDSDTMFVPDDDMIEYIHSAAVTSNVDYSSEADEIADESFEKRISYNGKYYTLNKDIVTVIFMGIDVDSSVFVDDGVQTGTHQADVLMVGAFNTKTGDIKLINIPRDSMVDVYKLDAMYRYAYTERAQIATQYSFGDGSRISSTYTMDAASRLLYGVPIYRYVTLSLTGITRAVELVDGVEISFTEDYTDIDPSFQKGATVILDGKTAEKFCRTRDIKIADSNLDRMQRQILFCKAFLDELKQKVKSNPAFLVTFYNEVIKECITNLSFDEAMLLAKQGLGYNFSSESLMTLPGQMVEREYIVDDGVLLPELIDLFYVEAPDE